MGRMVVAIGMPFDRAVGIGNERRTIPHRLGYGNRRNAILIGQPIAIQAVQPQLPTQLQGDAFVFVRDRAAVWVFQSATSLTVGAAGAPRSIILINGAQAKNVFWRVGTAATINAAGGGTMVGTIIASAAVAISTVGNVDIVTINGRAMGLNASVTMTNTVINVPAQ